MNQDREGEITGDSSQPGIGQTLGHFRVLSHIGTGGMGTVFLAQDLELDRKVALKYLSPELVGDEQFQARFRREARILANLNHPNIVSIYEAFHADGRSFIAMEYVEGKTLSELKNSTPEEVCKAAIEIASGLKAAHDAGIIHRDIKPANILVSTDGRVKLLDFGLAKRGADQDITRVGATTGTFAYMSPEQVKGMIVDARSDIFSFGIVLYELVHGRRPFKGEYAAEIAQKIVSEPPSTLGSETNDLPPELLQIIGRCLEKNPADRYQDAGLLIDDLRYVNRLLTGQGYSNGRRAVSHTDRQPSTPDRSGGPSQIPEVSPLPKKVPLVLGFLLALAGIILLTIWTSRPFHYNQTVTTSPFDAEQRALDILKSQNISLFGFHSHTYAVTNDTTQDVARGLALPSADIEALDPWSPAHYYLTSVVSADGEERYEILTSRDGAIVSFSHSLRPDTKPDTIPADSARYFAWRFSEEVLGVRLSDLKELPASLTRSAEGFMTNLQWVKEKSLPGEAVGEVRATFAGTHLTSIRKNASFPELVRRSAGGLEDIGETVAEVLVLLAYTLLGVVATRERAWHFPSRRVILCVVIVILLPMVLLIRPSYYSETTAFSSLTEATIFLGVMGLAMVAFVILSFAAAFGLIERERPNLLAGLRNAPIGTIGRETLIGSAAVGMIVGALLFIVQTLSGHLILTAYGMEAPLSLWGEYGTHLADTLDTLGSLLLSIGTVSMAIACAVVLAKYLRSGTAGWLLMGIVWASVPASFWCSDGVTRWLALSGLVFVAAMMWVTLKYGLLAGILTAAGREIVSHALALTHSGTGYYRPAGYVWLAIWLLIAVLSSYYVMRRIGSKRLVTS